jgi:glyoxylase I family protein
MTDLAQNPTAAGTARPAAPLRLHHVAYVTGDTAATVDFYQRIMGMDFVAAVMDEAIPSTREPVPYFHSFFKMGSGETIAYFEAPDLTPPVEEPTAAYRTFRHLALDVGSMAEVDRWKAWLEANDVSVIGPVDHGIIYSIYFFDPSGVRLELTCNQVDDWNAHGAEARGALDEWEQVKARARADGSDLTEALDRLATERSHRRANQLD